MHACLPGRSPPALPCSALRCAPDAPLVLQASGAAAGGGPPGETPQERLKRIMQAQLNKQAQKDTVAVTQKKIQVQRGWLQ